jgi:hypothetical protein
MQQQLKLYVDICVMHDPALSIVVDRDPVGSRTFLVRSDPDPDTRYDVI